MTPTNRRNQELVGDLDQSPGRAALDPNDGAVDHELQQLLPANRVVEGRPGQLVPLGKISGAAAGYERLQHIEHLVPVGF